jgi:DNA-binding NarL/FixJ family response regulator
MPDVDGWQFLQEFIPIKSALSKEVNIYIISSSNHPRDVSRAESIPEVKGFFLKPVTLETLKELASAVKH